MRPALAAVWFFLFDDVEDFPLVIGVTYQKTVDLTFYARPQLDLTLTIGPP